MYGITSSLKVPFSSPSYEVEPKALRPVVRKVQLQVDKICLEILKHDNLAMTPVIIAG